MRATDQELQAMANLVNDHNFQVFMKFLESWLKDETDQCITAEKPIFSQGRAQALTEITATVEKARESVSHRVATRAVLSIPRENAF